MQIVICKKAKLETALDTNIYEIFFQFSMEPPKNTPKRNLHVRKKVACYRLPDFKNNFEQDIAEFNKILHLE